MDHHAAHERVVFEQLLQSNQAGSPTPSQQLLIPVILEYSPSQARALEAYGELLKSIGFTIEVFGQHDFAVKGIPPWLEERSIEPLFSELVEIMLDTGTYGDPERLRHELLKRIACKTAVKESEQLHHDEIRALLAKLDHAEMPEVCPHGRPIFYKISLDEVRKKLGRR